MTGTAWTHRPLRRYLARLYCRFRFGKRRAHAEEWWPGLKLVLPSEEEPGGIEHRGRAVQRLCPIPLAGRSIEEVLIVGSGPSLSDLDMSKLPIEQAFLLNGAIHLLRDDRHPLGVVVEDERFVWRHFTDMRARIPAGSHCYLSTSAIRAVCEIDADWLRTRHIHHLDFLHRPYERPRPSADELRRLPFTRWTENGSAGISLESRLGLVAGGSVATTAAQLALALRPQAIGFVGVDLNNTKEPRFHEVEGRRAMSRIDRALDRILATLFLIGEEADRNGIRLKNHSPGSALSSIGIPYSPL